MLKKKTLTEAIYNNGDPYPIRKSLDAIIGGWQNQDQYQILWESLTIETEEEEVSFMDPPATVILISVDGVYNAGN